MILSKKQIEYLKDVLKNVLYDTIQVEYLYSGGGDEESIFYFENSRKYRNDMSKDEIEEEKEKFVDDIIDDVIELVE